MDMRHLINLVEAPGRVTVQGRKLFIDKNYIGDIEGWRDPKHRSLDDGYFLSLPDGRTLFRHLYPKTGVTKGVFPYARELVQHVEANVDQVLADITRPTARGDG